MTHRSSCAALAITVLLAGCAKHHESAANSAPATSAPPPAAASAPVSASAAPVSRGDDVAGLAQGALVVAHPSALESGTAAELMLDEDPHSRWTSAEGKAADQVVVIALPERSSIDRLQFDEAEIGLDTHGPKQVRVELSDSSATDGFRPLAEVILPPANADGETFAADSSISGRWLRLTVLSNYGGPITEIPEFHAFGKRLTSTPLPDLTGTYRRADGGVTCSSRNTGAPSPAATRRAPRRSSAGSRGGSCASPTRPPTTRGPPSSSSRPTARASSPAGGRPTASPSIP